jgi:hypothetical protein
MAYTATLSEGMNQITKADMIPITINAWKAVILNLLLPASGRNRSEVYDFRPIV